MTGLKRPHILLLLSALFSLGLHAQQTLSLDSCRALALRNNKALAIGRAGMDKAYNERRAAQTNYLPKVSLMAGYVRSGAEISLLNDSQKGALTGMGTQVANGFGQIAGQIVQQHPDLAPLIQQLGGSLGHVSTMLNSAGQDIVDAFRTDNRNMVAAAVMLTQPLYMGGKIRAYDRITHYSEEIAGLQLKADEQQVILEVDQAYWQVVSLANKRRLAVSYRDMLQRIDEDIEKMIAEGVATRADELSVSVKLNEAEMALAKVDDGLQLSRMLLNQTCGLPIGDATRLSDEANRDLPVETSLAVADANTAFESRPELNQLQAATRIYEEKVKVERAAFLPQLALTAGYLTTNPSVTNGFDKRFRGTWSVGVMLKVPVWNWGEMRYKVRAAKAEALVASLRSEEAREKVELQVNQSALRVNEAARKLTLSLKNLDKAEENLRTARIGFKEGVIATSDLLAAQTAWLQAHNDKIDAQIDMKLTRTILGKATGTLTR